MQNAANLSFQKALSQASVNLRALLLIMSSITRQTVTEAETFSILLQKYTVDSAACITVWKTGTFESLETI